MGTSLGPKYIPYAYMDPLGLTDIGAGTRQEVFSGKGTGTSAGTGNMF